MSATSDNTRSAISDFIIDDDRDVGLCQFVAERTRRQDATGNVRFREVAIREPTRHSTPRIEKIVIFSYDYPDSFASKINKLVGVSK